MTTKDLIEAIDCDTIELSEALEVQEEQNEDKKLLMDVRGSSFVEKIIIVGVVGLLGFGAFKALGGSISGKASEQAGTVDTIPGGFNGSGTEAAQTGTN